MQTLLLVFGLMVDVPADGAPVVPAPAAPAVEQLVPLDVPSRPSSYPLSPALFDARPASGPISWRDPLDAPAPRPTRDPLRDPLDLEWLIAPRPDRFDLRRDDMPRIDPYDFSARPPVLEVRTSTWMDPWRERELYESLYELRDANGVNLRIGVGRSDCWWR